MMRSRPERDCRRRERERTSDVESAGARRMIVPNHRVLTGLDVLEEQKFAPLQGKRVGLITNQTGLDRDGRRNVDAMRAAGVNVTAAGVTACNTPSSPAPSVPPPLTGRRS